MIVFGPIMKMLSENGWSSYRLRNEKVIPEGTLSRIRSGRPITTSTIDTLCRLCRCQPGDLISYVPELEKEERD